MVTSRPSSFQALYNRYRPQRFEQLIGQEHVVRTLQNALAHNRLSHAYLFSGERGTGKTTAARLLAKAVNCLEGIQPEPCGTCAHCRAIAEGSLLDLVEMDAASHSGIDDIREIRDMTRFAPGAARYRVYIIDEVHQLSAQGKDALLKTLEEPPPQALFVLATTESHRVPATIRSRTQHLTFRRIGLLELTTQLRSIAESESAEVEDAALHLLARNAGGSSRDAVSLLDQALAYGDNQVTSDSVNSMLGLTGRDAVVELLGHLMHGDTAAGLHAIGMAIDNGTSPHTLRQQMVGVLRDVLVLKTSPDTNSIKYLTQDEVFELSERTTTVDIPEVVRALEVFAQPDPPSRSGINNTLEFELSFARAVIATNRPPNQSQPARHNSDSDVAQTAPSLKQKTSSPTDEQVNDQSASDQEGHIRQPSRTGQEDGESRGTDLTADQIRARREDWLSSIRKEARTIAPYVEQADVQGFADGTVTLEYLRDFMLERVEQVDALRLVAKALSQTFGQPINVRNVLKSTTPPPQQPRPNTRVDDDPVVRVAMREYGATPGEGETKPGA